MIIKQTFYAVKCDVCETINESEYQFWNSESYAIEVAGDSDWHIDDDNHYCPDCWTLDENGEVKIKQKS